MTAHSPAMDLFIEEARAVSILEALRRSGFSEGGLRRTGAELVGPCPACGGTDRFQVNAQKGVFLCRGTAEGDAIALVRHLTGEDFVTACETLTGRERPGPEKSAAERRAAAEAREEAAGRMQDLREAAARKAEAESRASESYRDAELQRLRRTFAEAEPCDRPGSPVHAYLAARGIADAPVVPAFLRAHPALGFFHQVRGPSLLIHTGAAMLAPFMLVDPAGGWRMIGLHQTWLAPDGPKGRPVLYGLTKAGDEARRPAWRASDGAPAEEDLAAGLYERLPTKKMRGTKKGGLIPLVGRLGEAHRMVAGEGIETVLAFGQREGFPAGTFYCAAGDLGNLCGRAAQDSRVRHPFLKKRDARGRERAVMVPGEEPDFDAAAMPVPDWITTLVLLGDGDSEPVMTRLAMKRGARRHAREGRAVSVEMAPPGMDFSDLAEGKAA